MSRTDVHRPYWVQLRDPRLRRHVRVEHVHTERACWDHELRRWLVRREVPCDLHVFLSATTWVPTHCRLTYWGGRNIACGCWMCTGQPWRKRRHRSDRTAWRAAARQLLGRVDRDDADVPPPQRPGW